MPNPPYCKQMDLLACGAASVEVIARHLQRDVTQQQIADWLGIAQRGYTSKEALRSVLERLQIPFREYAEQGPEAEVMRLSPERFTLMPQGNIEHVVELLQQDHLVLVNFLADDGEGHYGVIHEYRHGKLIIHDPYYGPDIPHVLPAFKERWVSEDRQWKSWRMAILC